MLRCLLLVDASFGSSAFGRYLDWNDLWGKLKVKWPVLHILFLSIESWVFKSFSELVTLLVYLLSSLSLPIQYPSYVSKADVFISWSDTQMHLTRQAPPHLWHLSGAGTGSRLLDQFIQAAAQMLLIFERLQERQSKLKVWGTALVATWNTSFTQLPHNSTVFTKHETTWQCRNFQIYWEMVQVAGS